MVYRTLTKEALENWTKNPTVNPYNNKHLDVKLTPLTCYLRDRCIENGILPPILPKAKNTAEQYRVKMKKEKVDFMCDTIQKTLEWINAGNEMKYDEETLKEIGIDLKSNIFASKV